MDRRIDGDFALRKDEDVQQKNLQSDGVKPFRSFDVLLGCRERNGLEAWYAALQTLAIWRPDLYRYVAELDWM